MLFCQLGSQLWTKKAGQPTSSRRLPRATSTSMKSVAAIPPSRKRRRRSISRAASSFAGSRTSRPRADRESREVGAHGLCCPSITACRSRHRRSRLSAFRDRGGDLPDAPRPMACPAPSVMTTTPASWQATIRGPSQRLSDLPAGMADAGLAEAPPAQLPRRHPCRGLGLRRAGICGARTFPDGSRQGDDA